MYFVRDKYCVGTFNDVKKYAAILDADTVEDLPEYNDCKGIDGELTLGTIAFIASEVIFMGMTSDGTWHKHGEDSSGVSTSSVSTNSLQANKALLSEFNQLPDMPDEYYTEDSEPLEDVTDNDELL